MGDPIGISVVKSLTLILMKGDLQDRFSRSLVKIFAPFLGTLLIDEAAVNNPLRPTHHTGLKDIVGY